MSRLNLISPFDYSISLIAIVSQSKGYNLAWNINKALGFEFEKTEEDWKIGNAVGNVRFFPSYIYVNEITETEHRLIKNLSAEGYLIPERKESDYFWLLNKKLQVQDEQWIISELNKLSVITKAYPLELKSLKSKENLMF